MAVRVGDAPTTTLINSQPAQLFRLPHNEMVGDVGSAPTPHANQACALLIKLNPRESGPDERTCTYVARRQMVYSHLQLLLWHVWMNSADSC